MVGILVFDFQVIQIWKCKNIYSSHINFFIYKSCAHSQVGLTLSPRLSQILELSTFLNPMSLRPET